MEGNYHLDEKSIHRANTQRIFSERTKTKNMYRKDCKEKVIPKTADTLLNQEHITVDHGQVLRKGLRGGMAKDKKWVPVTKLSCLVKDMK
ncbi:hypothetical protein DBR06_SOUSAS2710064 [Sousa chinensis]|nr:hypothetical protein DBR06_SOUSAS2710064 [Sousa chinensis]